MHRQLKAKVVKLNFNMILLIKTKVSKPEIKTKEYLDKKNNQEKHIYGSKSRLDLHVLIKKLKDEKNKDKKQRFLFTVTLIIVALLVLVFII